jgi:peptidoglycan/LPS O-acetylase OafA/YrhL
MTEEQLPSQTSNNSSRPEKSKYRPEIDGLRAFAVTAVIINHFNKDLLPSGYLGVDIFFVISGYVITSSMANRESKNFRDFIISFYKRRVKRLAPVLVTFVLTTSILICLFNPDPKWSLRIGAGALLGISNILLFRDSTDYFAQSTELNPFSHTWSLGVEEQFYLIFPLLIWLSGFGRRTKNGPRDLFIWTGALTVISLLGFIYLYPTNQPAAYFLMPPRFWEMSAGCLAFIGFKRRPKIEKALEQAPPMMVVLVIICVMLLPITAAVPSKVAIVLLSTILLACLKSGTAAFITLTNGKVVYIGLISYSLYLWHWTILSISRWTIGIHWWSAPIQLLSIFLLAAASYHIVEKPLRSADWSMSPNSLITAGTFYSFTTGTLLLAGDKFLSNTLYLGDKQIDFSAQVTRPIDFKGNMTSRVARECHSSDTLKNDALKGSQTLTDRFIAHCLASKGSQSPLIAFVGDSHTLSMFPLSERLYQNTRFSVFSHSRDGCAFPQQGATFRAGCMEAMKSTETYVINQVNNRKKGSVIIATSYLVSHFGTDGLHRRQFKKHPDGTREAVNSNLEDYLLSLKRLAGLLRKSNSHLIVVAPLPNHPLYLPETCLPQWFKPIWSIPIGCNKTPTLTLQKQRQKIVSSLQKLAKSTPGILIYDPLNILCGRSACPTSKEGKPLYSDDNHLSGNGANYIYGDFLRFMLKNNLLQEQGDVAKTAA